MGSRACLFSMLSCDNAPEVPIRQRLHLCGGPVRGARRSRAASAADARAFQLAQEITELASRANWRRGRHVTELTCFGLSVSRTPIRAALRLLQQHGCMETRPNRGFFLLKDGQNLTCLVSAAPLTADELLQQRLISDHASGRLPGKFYDCTPCRALWCTPSDARKDTRTPRGGKSGHPRSGPSVALRRSLEGGAGVRASYEVRLLLEPRRCSWWGQR